MYRTRRIRLSLGVATLAFGLLTTTTLGVVTASAVAKPVLKVTPATGLTNHRTVKVTGTGFKPKEQVYLVECLATASGGSQCNIAGAVPVTISAKGVFPVTTFKVVTGAIGKGKCGTKASNLKSCALSAGTASGTDTAVARITFKLAKG